MPDLIHKLGPGDEVVITENDFPIARLTPISAKPTKNPRQLGTMKGTVLLMATDFDEALDDVQDYLE